MRRLFIDRYSGNSPNRSDPRPANLLRLAEQYGFVGIVEKACMGGGPDYWQWHIAESDLVRAILRDRDLPWWEGIYHWIDPGQDWLKQAGYFLREIENVQPDFIAFDVEQWKSWAGAKFSAARIYDSTVAIIQYVLERTDLPWAPYSAKWFLGSYCPQLVETFAAWGTRDWVASYADYGKAVRKVGRVEFLAWVDQVAAMPLPSTGIGVMRNPILRQCSSTQILPPCSANYDVSIVLNDAAFDAWLRGE